MGFKVNYEDCKGVAKLRSRYNCEGTIRRSTGIAFHDKHELKRLEVRLLDIYDALKALPKSDRIRHYGTAVINLTVIWKRYKDELGQADESRTEDTQISEQIMVEIDRFPQTQKQLSAHYVNYTCPMVNMHLGYFAKSQGYKRLLFKDLTRPFLTGYENYLKTEKTSFVHNGKIFKKRPLTTSTVEKHFGVITRACKYVAGEVEVHPAVLAYEIKTTNAKKETTSLSYEELMTVFYYRQDNPDVSLGLDIWLFMAFSGLRIGKTMELRKGDIGDGFIRWNNSKNKEQVVHTTVHRYNAVFLKKYLHQANRIGLLFPPLSRATIRVHINKALKDLSIRKTVGIHSARHTYNNLLRKVPVSDFDRMMEMGHQPPDINSKHYTKDDLEQRKANMVRIFEDLDIHIKKPMKISTLYNEL